MSAKSLSKPNNHLLILVLALALLSAGCTTEKILEDNKKEIPLSQYDNDLDGDTETDFYSYSYASSVFDQFSVKKYLIVTTEKDFQSLGPIKDVSSQFEQFKLSKEESDSKCGQVLGTSGIRCVDAKTCSKICESSSQKCKNLVQDYGDSLGHYIAQHIKDSGDLNKAADSATLLLARFDSLEQSDRLALISKLVSINNIVYSINSNPLRNTDVFDLCQIDDYGLPKITKILKDSKTSLSDKVYHYTILLKLESRKGSGDPGYTEVQILDIIPNIADLNQISSPQSIKVQKSNGKDTISWGIFKPYSKNRDILSYKFSSTIPPFEIANNLAKPIIKTTRTTFDFLLPVIFLFNILLNFGLNYYLALGIAFGSGIAVLLFLMNALIFAYNYARSKSVGEPFQIIVKRTFGRTGLRWKTDLIVAVVLLVIGVGAAFSTQPSLKTFDLFAIVGILLGDLIPSAAIVGTSLGVIFIYTALENQVKIVILEKIYGKKLKEDKDLFFERITQLKSRLTELKELIDQLSKSNYDVGEEYDLATGVSLKHIDELAKRNDPHSRDYIENELGKVEGAIDRLMEKKKAADENWEKWKAEIAKLISQHDEVYVSNLILIPASLRSWALNRFVQEYGHGLTFEGNVIKKKEISAEKFAESLLDKELLHGLIIIKGGKLTTSEMLKGSGTVTGVLGAKLVAYLRTLTQKLRMREYGSLAIVGDKSVLAVMKYRDVESVIFIPKEKFKEAIDDWKIKIKTL